MILEVSGGVLSSLIFDQLHTTSDQEGLIIGTVRVQTENVISDSQIDNKSERIIYEVEKTVVCPSLRYFYDKKGNILIEKLRELLSYFPSKHLIGWYKSRQNTLLDMSLWERKVHRSLCDYIRSSQPLVTGKEKTNPIFALFTTEHNQVLSNRVVNKAFYSYNSTSRRWIPVKPKIVNLGNTTSYYKQTRSDVIPECQSILAKYEPLLVGKDTRDVGHTQQIDSLAGDMCSKLQDICSQVEKSELEVSALEAEISEMKRVLCATISSNQGGDDVELTDSEPSSITDNNIEPSGTVPNQENVEVVLPSNKKVVNQDAEMCLIDLSEQHGAANKPGAAAPSNYKKNDSFAYTNLNTGSTNITSYKSEVDATINNYLAGQSFRQKPTNLQPNAPLSDPDNLSLSPPSSPVY